jgi:AraC-like DNA-binding protein
MLTDNPGISITDVAFASGFNDSNYFSDKFKRQYGISPIKFKHG